jgi:hypothetical protein
MHQDATKRQIKKGDYIAYCVTTGSSAGMKFGAVVKLKEKLVKSNKYNPQTCRYDIEHEEMDYTIQIISVEYGWERDVNGPDPHAIVYRWKLQGKKEGSKLARVQTIDRLNRVIMLEPDQMDPEVKEILDRELHERGQL